MSTSTGRAVLGSIATRALAAMAWFGVLLQFGLSIQLALTNGKSVAVGLVAYFGYFTILSNIFVAVVCSVGSFSRSRMGHSSLYRLPVIGCATTAILIVGLGYHFLLRKIWNPQGTAYVADVVLHYVVPVGAQLHWLIYSHEGRLSAWAPLSWCWYPLGYFGYVMARGEIIHSYPYHFIDVLSLGYAQSMVNAIGFLVGFIIVGYALIGLKRIAK